MFDGLFDTLGSVASGFGDIGSSVVNSFPDWAPVAAEVAGDSFGVPGMGSVLHTLGSVGDAVGAVGKAASPFMPAVSGLISSAGQAAANEANLQSVQKQIDFQRESQGASMSYGRDMQQRQMDYEERMSNTSYQRSMRDMAAAGLNPMLAFMKGGASTPAVSAPTVSGMPGAAARVENVAAAGVASAAQAASVRATLASASKMESESALNYALVSKAEQDVRTGVSSAAELDARAKDILWRLQWLGPAQHDLIGSESALNDMRSRLLNQERLTDRDRQLLFQVERRLDELRVPRASNEAAAESSWWKRNVSPFLPDVLRGSSSAAAVGSALR